MKSRIILIFAMIISWAALGMAQQLTNSVGKTDPAAAKVAGPAKVAATAKVPAKPITKSKSVDPDLAYKANCSRCHLEPRKFSERKTATLVRHMRVRANMTAEETEAVLHYLTR